MALAPTAPKPYPRDPHPSTQTLKDVAKSGGKVKGK